MTQALWPKSALAVPLLGSAIAVAAWFGPGAGWFALPLAATLVAGVLVQRWRASA